MGWRGSKRREGRWRTLEVNEVETPWGASTCNLLPATLRWLPSRDLAVNATTAMEAATGATAGTPTMRLTTAGGDAAGWG